MALNIITRDFRTNQAEQFLESFDEASPTYYYMFIGHSTPWPGGIIPETTNSELSSQIDVMNNMIAAKKINSTDTAICIERSDWVPNKVWKSYDHRSQDLTSTYVGVSEGSSYNVFKCLYNNKNAVSTVPPSFLAFSLVESANTETYDGYYETSDGYQWKYMFTVDEQDMDKFSTNKYVPVYANTSVESFAVDGAIDVIEIESAGSGYTNFFSGEFSANSDVAYLGNSTYMAIRASNDVTPSAIDDFYNGCILKITSGTGAGQYREVVDYINSGSARYAIVNNAFTVFPDTSSSYEISPKVTILGANKERAEGRALKGPGSTIGSIEILNRGKGYFLAQASIIQSNVASVSNNAVLVPIMGPSGGHGANPKTELGARWASIVTKFDGTENGAIPPGQKFSQIGILRDPLFANLEISTVKYSNTDSIGRDGGFIEGEQVLVFKPIRQNGDLIVEAGNNIVVAANTTMTNLASIKYPNNRVFIRGANTADWFVSKIISTSNSTIVLENNCPINSNNASFYISESNTQGTHISSGPSWSLVDNVSPFINPEDAIIGLTTYSVAVVDSIQINNRPFDYDVLNQLSILSISGATGTLTEDEYLSDGLGNSCSFYSQANGSHMYVTNLQGEMAPGTLLRNPGATASVVIANKYSGDIVQGSASILYVENHESVSRSTSTSQTKKIIVEF